MTFRKTCNSIDWPSVENRAGRSRSPFRATTPSVHDRKSGKACEVNSRHIFNKTFYTKTHYMWQFVASYCFVALSRCRCHAVIVALSLNTMPRDVIKAYNLLLCHCCGSLITRCHLSRCETFVACPPLVESIFCTVQSWYKTIFCNFSWSLTSFALNTYVYVAPNVLAVLISIYNLFLQ